MTDRDSKSHSRRDEYLQSAINRLEVERAELESVLASGFLGRTNNVVRLLSYVCEKYFEGAIDEVKEYSIAVQALGRADDFDPQVDTIVRVPAHALRKRLEDYYRTAGARHPVHISLPPGHYAPKFIHKGDLDFPVLAELHENHAGQSLDNASPMENGLPQPHHNALPSPLPENGEQHLTVAGPVRIFRFPGGMLRS